MRYSSQQELGLTKWNRWEQTNKKWGWSNKWCCLANQKKSWLVVSTPLKNMKVSWECYSKYMESQKIPWFQTTNQEGYHTRNMAFIWPWCFCDQRGVMDDVWCGRANRILVDVISKAKKTWFWCIKSKSSVWPRRNYHFWCFSELPN